MKSVFTDKTKTPAPADLKKALGKTYVVSIKIETLPKQLHRKQLLHGTFQVKNSAGVTG
ncbi:MAG: hypothetical protein IPG39_15455 [Bacteroidetes bacterium]|nr:hypothetical protein [Bacteroidota bacterium]